MILLSTASYLIVLVSTALSADALQVAPGSPCAHNCLGSPADNNWDPEVSKTNSSEIACFDNQFSSSKVGLKYKRCQECLQTSTRGNWGETDAKWFIYNARFALDVCLFDTPKASDDGAVSPCSTNQACKNLKKSLTSDGLPSNQNTTWDYCFADDGAFMAAERAQCVQCLRDSQNQTFLANFITALDAGCHQTPEKDTAISLSGTIFTSQAVRIVDPEFPPHPDESGPRLSTGAIIGIAVAVIVTILVAIGLLVFYCARERERNNTWEDDYFPDEIPPTYSVHAVRHNMAQARLRAEQQQQQAQAAANFQYLRYEDRSLPGEKPRAYATSGDYYDDMERRRSAQSQEQPRGRSTYRMEDLSPVARTHRASTATLPSHPAVKRDPSSSATITESRAGSATGVSRQRLSPPASVHRPVRTNTPDSFAVQAYLDAAAESARLAAVAAAAQAAPSASSQTTNSPRSSKRRSMLSLFSLRSGGSSNSSVFRKGSRQGQPPPGYIFQPPLTNDKAFHGDKNISRPILAREEPRFLESAIAGRPNVGAPAARAVPRPPSPADKYKEYGEVPLRSGKSDLYGM